jgi:hypothetical protein
MRMASEVYGFVAAGGNTRGGGNGDLAAFNRFAVSNLAFKLPALPASKLVLPRVGKGFG